MANPDPSRAVFKTEPEQLSALFNLNEHTADAWTEQDLPAMLRHQLAAPLEFDLGTLEVPPAEITPREQTLKAAAASRIRTFQELLQHPRPPLKLLTWAKDFFKQQAGSSQPRRPEQQVGYVLYLLSILTARVRLQTRISRLTDADLLRAVNWVAEQSWLDATTREMCRLARKTLHAAASG